MAQVRIEMDRGAGWEVRQEGEASVTRDALIDMLPSYAIQYPHRAMLDGELVATCTCADVSRRGWKAGRRPA